MMRWTNPQWCAIHIALRSGMRPVELAALLDVDDRSIYVGRPGRIYVDEAIRHGLDDVSFSWCVDVRMFDEQAMLRVAIPTADQTGAATVVEEHGSDHGWTTRPPQGIWRL